MPHNARIMLHEFMFRISLHLSVKDRSEGFIAERTEVKSGAIAGLGRGGSQVCEASRMSEDSLPNYPQLSLAVGSGAEVG
jgi:hypothetical protein